MSEPVDTRPTQLAALQALSADAPVVMINLLKFNEGGGRERYLQYGREVAPHLARVGATVRYSGNAPVNVIGDGERPWWDAILVVEYPTRPHSSTWSKTLATNRCTNIGPRRWRRVTWSPRRRGRWPIRPRSSIDRHAGAPRRR